MRKTITLDPDVEALVKREMGERGISFKQVEIPGHKVLQFVDQLEDREFLA